MTIEEQIAALLAKAEPLRSLQDHEQEAQGLPGIVDQINELRLIQEKGKSLTYEQELEKNAVARSIEEDYGRKPLAGEVEYVTDVLEAKKRRGRPPKNKEAE